MAACALLAYAFLRLALVHAIGINSDEPQHAHVAWAWSQGLVPYRDVFDNHAPLFHMLYAPIVGWLGETPYILDWLRLAIVPISMLALGSAYVIAESLWNRKVALWAILLVFACPSYLYVAGQFRTDVLWGSAWLAVIAIAVVGRWSPWRALAVGLAIGIAFAVSLKTMLLVAGLGLAWALVHAGKPADSRPPQKAVTLSALLILLGSAVVPAFVLAIVAMKGGLVAMRYCVLEHNMLHGLGHSGYTVTRWAWMSGLLVLLIATILKQRQGRYSPRQARRALVMSSALIYALLLLGTWPLVTRQDQLPVVPLLAIGLAGWWHERSLGHGAWLPFTLAALGLVFVSLHGGFQPRTGQFRTTLGEVLAITSPRDFVMDDKGASIYRQRPFYFALENITLERIRRGLIPDDISRRLIDTDTHVVWADRLPARDRTFVQAHYLPLGDGLRVAGLTLSPLRTGESWPVRILLPGAYTLLAAGRRSEGSFDGGDYLSTKVLGAGVHTLEVAHSGDYLLVWQPAAPLFERGLR